MNLPRDSFAQSINKFLRLVLANERLISCVSISISVFESNISIIASLINAAKTPAKFDVQRLEPLRNTAFSQRIDGNKRLAFSIAILMDGFANSNVYDYI
ncbi:hypothetical protein DERP_006063 [Dermatophagoides pteronyssinus]|uniref:Uncharacterized protein n=1 Tax=Dermatophagoides pteronyssinus TaxID=6956 RepID=A0ABQ8JST3_DERPT|nr:hypothetical protein DERP_006063 [Dermatophagoides pteronyssinus]